MKKRIMMILIGLIFVSVAMPIHAETKEFKKTKTYE